MPFAFTPRGICGSRTCPSPAHPVPTQVTVASSLCGICGTDLHEYIAGPIVTPSEPHPLTGAQLPRSWGTSSRPRCVAVGAGCHRVGRRRPCGDHAADVLRALRLLPPRPAASLRDDGVHRPQRGLGRHRGAREGRGVPGVPSSRRRLGRAGRADRAVRGRRLRRGPRRCAARRQRPRHRGGPIGALAALCAAAAGAGAVFISEPNRARRERAERLGLGETLDPAAVDVPEVLRERTGGLGVDVAVECVGTGAALNTCVDSARRRGTVVQTGLHVAPATSTP